MKLQTKKKQNEKQYDIETLIKNADIFYGSGGSQNAIFIYKNTATKLIPNFKKGFNETEKYNNDQEEIKFYKEFTKHLILKNKTPHIVGFYDNKKINMYSLLDKYINKCPKITVWEQLYSAEQDKQDNYIQYSYEDYLKSQDKSNTTIKPGLLESIVTFIKGLTTANKTKKADTQSKYSIYTSKTKKANTTVKHISKEKENIEDIICQYRKVAGEYVNSWFSILEKGFDLCYVEYCPTSIDKEFGILVANPGDIDNKQANVSAFLHRVVFQFMFTMCAIYEKYPTFIHNDCFLRNILAVNETHYKSNDYVEYIVIRKKDTKTISTKKYYMPANGICIKLNDFGYSFAMPELGDKLSFEEKIYNAKFITNNKKAPSFTNSNKHKSDIWNFLFDLYNGANFGAMSCHEIIKRSKLPQADKTKLQHIVKTTLHNYINTDIVDKLKTKKYNMIDGVWNIINIPELQKAIQYPENYFINDFNFKEFQYTNTPISDKKEKTNTTPYKRNIIKTFTVCIN